MMVQTWGDVLLGSLQGLWMGVVAFLPKLILAVAVFIIGWLIAELIKKGFAHLIDAIKLDKLLESTGLDELVRKAGYKLNSGLFIGELIKWFFIIVFLVAALDIIGLSQVTLFLQQVALVFLPNVIVAALVLLVVSVLADFVDKALAGSARAAHVASAPLLGKVAKWSIWIFGILIALAQLGIAAQLVQILFTGFVAMLALAGGLAFGLGGKEAASDVVKSVRDGIRNN
jgi:small-conductance mechanosensitive channel